MLRWPEIVQPAGGVAWSATTQLVGNAPPLKVAAYSVLPVV